MSFIYKIDTIKGTSSGQDTLFIQNCYFMMTKFFYNLCIKLIDDNLE